MITTLTKKWNAMRTTEKGGVLIFVALCLLPMFLILGLAVDSSYGLTEKRKLQMACDAAAKAGVANGGGVSATITSEAQKVFAANIANMTGITGPTISVNTSAKTVTVSASIVVSNVFMVLGGVPTSTYSATTTTSYGTALAEVVIIIEGSQRAAYASNFQQNVCAQLISFVNSLPSNVMVSIIPLSGEFSFDPSTTVSGNLFNHLSSTTNDESANPGYYPLSTNYAWTLANYNAIPNPYYGGLSQYPSAPTRTSYTSPATCPGSYSSCSSTLYTANCPSTTHQSCSSTYAYNHLPTYPMLPLTLNRTLITNYINSIKNFNSWSDAFFPSMISWAWRAIDPSWNDFWLVNSDLSATTRASGTYPNPYGGKQKSIIIISYDQPYWDEYPWTLSTYYTKKCGDRTTSNGDGTTTRQWSTNNYGAIPVPTDYYANINDITCENNYYKTVDQSLGLSLSSLYWNGNQTSANYKTSILTEVGNKFLRICSSLRSNSIDIYVISQANTSYYTPCCNVSSNAYTVSNSQSSIGTALTAIQTKIAAKV